MDFIIEINAVLILAAVSMNHHCHLLLSAMYVVQGKAVFPVVCANLWRGRKKVQSFLREGSAWVPHFLLSTLPLVGRRNNNDFSCVGKHLIEVI